MYKTTEFNKTDDSCKRLIMLQYIRRYWEYEEDASLTFQELEKDQSL